MEKLTSTPFSMRLSGSALRSQYDRDGVVVVSIGVVCTAAVLSSATSVSGFCTFMLCDCFLVAVVDVIICLTGFLTDSLSAIDVSVAGVLGPAWPVRRRVERRNGSVSDASTSDAAFLLAMSIGEVRFCSKICESRYNEEDIRFRVVRCRNEDCIGDRHWLKCRADKLEA